MANGGNFCVLNYINNLLSGNSGSTNVLIKSGNLETEDQGSYYSNYVGTIAVQGTGKWYYEYRVVTAANNGNRFGWIDVSQEQNVTKNGGYPGSSPYSWTANNNGVYSKIQFSNNNSTFAREYTGASQAAGDIWCIGLDLSTGKWYVSKNAALDPSSAATSSTSSGTLELHDNLDGGLYAPSGGEQAGSDAYYNFGQDSTFGGAETAGGNSDASGYGDFLYAVPSGYKALCSGNMDINENIDPAETDDNYSFKLVAGTNWVGSGASKALTGLGFQPDLVIIESADQAGTNWGWFDSTRGVQKYISSNATTAQTTDSNSLTAFGSDGFTVGSTAAFNGSFYLLSAFAWRANGGTTATNDTGGTDSTVQANTAGGFSIVKWTGTGSATTLGHSLGVAPKLIIVKDTTNANDWGVYHGSVASDPQTDYLLLNSTAAVADDATYWNDTAPTSTVFSVGTNADTNTSSAVMMAYAWAEVDGYSKFTKYKGNASANGPFIYTGFLPRIVWIKRTDSTSDWSVYKWDTTSANAGYMDLAINPIEARLELNTGNSRDTGEPIDFISNGIKIRDSDAAINADGGTYIVCAWGNKPFKYNNTLSTP